VLALPVAFFMAKVASRRWQPSAGRRDPHAAVGVYLVKAYAWRSMFGGGG
jgi:putative spermidine/putrescine transport system permease protein